MGPGRCLPPSRRLRHVGHGHPVRGGAQGQRDVGGGQRRWGPGDRGAAHDWPLDARAPRPHRASRAAAPQGAGGGAGENGDAVQAVAPLDGFADRPRQPRPRGAPRAGGRLLAPSAPRAERPLLRRVGAELCGHRRGERVFGRAGPEAAQARVRGGRLPCRPGRGAAGHRGRVPQLRGRRVQRHAAAQVWRPHRGVLAGELQQRAAGQRLRRARRLARARPRRGGGRPGARAQRAARGLGGRARLRGQPRRPGALGSSAGLRHGGHLQRSHRRAEAPLEA
mmetsp:Transcript_87369/g.227937  ORF Transcript_87369/g.227937 Transcript_87369/m.227937 type:complete len:280 (-) Transcript_87369:375-1214(-)